MADTIDFVRTIVEECSTFFYTLHVFCHNYVQKINKRGNKKGRKIDYSARAVEMMRYNHQNRRRKMASPYILFFREQAKILKGYKRYEKSDGKELSKIVAGKWRALSEEEKDIYRDQAHHINVTRMRRVEVEERMGQEEEGEEEEEEKEKEDSDDISKQEAVPANRKKQKKDLSVELKTVPKKKRRIRKAKKAAIRDIDSMLGIEEKKKEDDSKFLMIDDDILSKLNRERGFTDKEP